MRLRDLLRRPRPRRTAYRRYAEYDPSGRVPDPRAAISGDSLRVTIEVNVESLIIFWARDRCVPVEQARRDFKAAVRSAVNQDFLQRVGSHLNASLGGDPVDHSPVHYVTAGVK
jgi:hypothetical protein